MSDTNLRLWALCLGNFVIGTGALIVPGMLPGIAEGLNVSLPVAGQLIAAFAAAVCIGAPLLATATSRFDRRSLLAATLAIYFAGHLAAALVSSFAAMLSVRLLSSVGAALFTAQAAAVAALLVPAEQRGRAIAFVFLGWSVASVAGIPLGAYVGATLGWRAGFVLVAAGAAITGAAVWLLIPAGLYVKTADAKMWRAIVGNPAVLALLAATALSMGATFSLFSFFVPAAQAFVDASPATVSVLLAAFGAAGLAGNTAAARYMDRFGPGSIFVLCAATTAVAHLLWPLTPGSVAFLLAVALASGAGVFASNGAQQARLVAISPSQASVSVALNTSAVFLGQAGGSAATGLLIAYLPGKDGFAAIPWLSVPLLILAIALSLFASHRMRAQPGSAHVQGRPA